MLFFFQWTAVKLNAWKINNLHEYEMENNWATVSFRMTHTKQELALDNKPNMWPARNCSLYVNINKLSLACMHTHTHARTQARTLSKTHTCLQKNSQARHTARVTSACLGWSRSGNWNYIIKRFAARGALGVTQCFQLWYTLTGQVRRALRSLESSWPWTAHQYRHK